MRSLVLYLLVYEGVGACTVVDDRAMLQVFSLKICSSTSLHALLG